MNDNPTTENPVLPLSEKYALTIKEAAIYFNIGNKKLRRLAEENLGRFAVESGNRFLIIRPKFELRAVSCPIYHGINSVYLAKSS